MSHSRMCRAVNSLSCLSELVELEFALRLIFYDYLSYLGTLGLGDSRNYIFELVMPKKKKKRLSTHS